MSKEKKALLPMKKVDSSNIKSIGYDEAKEKMDVKFKNGSVYRFSNVEPETYKELIGADSIGAYFAQNIKNNYKFEKLRDKR